MSTVRRAWARAEPHVGTRWSLALLVASALAVYAVEALAWPVQRGRDAWDYLVFYLSLFDGSTPFPLVMLVRSPVTAVALGVPMQIGGAEALELFAGVLFAVTVVAWTATALTFSRLGAVLTAIVSLVVTPFALPFHEPSSDMVVAAGFALFSLGLVRTWLRPTALRFVALGLGAAAVTLARPSYQALVVVAVVPLALRAPWRVRLLRTGAYVLALVVPLALWAVNNGVRYGDTTVSRSGILNVPFYPAFLAHEIKPDNGPASRRLAELVQHQVLVLPPYRDLGVGTRTYFASGQNYEVVRLAGLVDRVDGLSSDYGLLRDAAREIRVPGDLVVRGTNVSRSARNLREWLVTLPPFEFRTKPDRWPEPKPVVDVGGKPFPNPAAQPPAPDAVPYGFLQCATDEISRCILADPARVLPDPALARRYASVTRTVQRWDEGLGHRKPVQGLASALERLRNVLPPPLAWLIVAAAALALRRPRHWAPLTTVAGLALVLLAAHALGGRPDPFYALPLLPAFPVVALSALTASAHRGGEGLA